MNTQNKTLSGGVDSEDALRATNTRPNDPKPSPPPQTIAEIMEKHGFSEQYVDERLGRDASWPQIIEAVNYCLANACNEAYKMGWYERHNMTTIRAQTAGDYPQRRL